MHSFSSLNFALALTFLLLISPIAANQPIDVKNVNLDNHIHEFRQIDICTGIKIPIGTDDMSLRFDAISNIKHILISNAPFEFCEDIASVKCPGSSTYCEHHVIADNEKNNLNHKLFPNGFAYLYALPETDDKISFELKIAPMDKPIIFNSANSEAKESSFTEPEAPRNKPDDQETKGSQGGVFRIILSIFLLGTLAFVSIVGYYRYQYRKYHFKPFSVPRWCPNFLFPRRGSNLTGSFISLEPRGNRGEDYEPPMAVL